MILLTFRTKDGPRLGVKTDKGIVDVKAAVQSAGGDTSGVPTTPEALYRGGITAAQALSAFVKRIGGTANASWLLKEADLQLAPCVPDTGKVICIGLNYRRHAAETGAAIPQTPVVFSKFATSIAAPGENIPLPKSAEQYDYEAELAVVIGRRARDIAEADALNYVLGYCNANDLSARDLQNRTSQWLLGKGLDKFLPVGPYVVTTDEIPDPQTLGVRCWLNGELRQNSNTGDMIFSVAQLVSYLSKYLALEPGDIISTGTPEGVILGMKEKKWLKAGDKVTIEVDKLGQLTNTLTQ